jgi:hypothetical protein
MARFQSPMHRSGLRHVGDRPRHPIGEQRLGAAGQHQVRIPDFQTLMRPVLGLLTRPERGRYLLTERGRKVLQDYPDRVDMTVLSQFPEYQEFRARKSEKQLEKSVAVVADEVSLSESIGQIVEESYDELAAELLDRILCRRPSYAGQVRRWR